MFKVPEVHSKSWSTNVTGPLPLHFIMYPLSLEWLFTSKGNEKNSTREYTKRKLKLLGEIPKIKRNFSLKIEIGG